MWISSVEDGDGAMDGMVRYAGCPSTVTCGRGLGFFFFWLLTSGNCVFVGHQVDMNTMCREGGGLTEYME